MLYYDAILRNWYEEKWGEWTVIVGDIFGDKKERFDDGSTVKTSTVESITHHVLPVKAVILKTKNSVYKLENPKE